MNEDSGTIQISTNTDGDRSVISVTGEVDLRTSPQLRASLLEAAGDMAKQLLIDLSRVTYMDSSGVGTLVFVKREVERAGGRLILVGPQPRVRSVLEITHLDKFFTIAGSVGEVPQT